jgi:hypothetical protein
VAGSGVSLISRVVWVFKGCVCYLTKVVLSADTISSGGARKPQPQIAHIPPLVLALN